MLRSIPNVGRNKAVIESTTVLLFGLPGVKVTGVFGQSDGSRVVEVVTYEDTAAACPSCGGYSTTAKARVRSTPKDNCLRGEPNRVAVEQDRVALPGRLS